MSKPCDEHVVLGNICLECGEYFLTAEQMEEILVGFRASQDSLKLKAKVLCNLILNSKGITGKIPPVVLGNLAEAVASGCIQPYAAKRYIKINQGAS